MHVIFRQPCLEVLQYTVKNTLGSAIICILCPVLCGFTSAADFNSKAWSILKAGVSDQSAAKRQQAVSALGIVTGSPRAADLAEHALQDSQTSVRKAAVIALGAMGSRSSLPKIKAMLPSANAEIVVASAAVLKQFDDPEGYEIYYEILTGKRTSGGGILSGLKDRKALEKMGIEEAIGFIPFGGIGIGAYEYFKHIGTSGVDAVAAAALASDPDQAAREALVHASFGGKDIVRLAALQALARRGDPSVVGKIEPAMYSGTPLISYTAAAAVAHLTDTHVKR
jgi:HEAT repeat protein